MKFNLSYSSLSLYLESPRTFYYRYIKKINPPDDTIEVYGIAGNVVHNCLEAYVNHKTVNFEKEWMNKGLNHMKGFNEQPLSLPIYKTAFETGKRIIDGYRIMQYHLTTEEKIQFVYDKNPDVTIKGFIDLIMKKGEAVVIIDYKTDSSCDKVKHRQQRLFYSWLYWKKHGVIPTKCIWYYLKLSKEFSESFKLKELKEFDTYIHGVITEIQTRGNNEESYPIGNIDSPFNGYKSLMGLSPSLPKKKTKTVKLTIQNARIYLEGVDPQFVPTLVGEFSFEVEGSFFVKREMGKKGVHFDGYKRFYKTFDNSLPIGFLSRLKKVLEENNHEIIEIDKRNGLRRYLMPKRLRRVKLRDYQKRAVDYVMDHKILTVDFPTASGKTVIAAEIIRRVKGLTLFVVDRDVLLTQTKNEFEELLGMEVGTITEGVINLKIINVATIQTINSLLKSKTPEFLKILSNIELLMIDEAHGSKAKSYIKLGKHVTNAQYRVGLTGTYEELGVEKMSVESVVGYNEMKINVDELIEKGYVMKPKIFFMKYKCKPPETEKYGEQYKEMIVNNEARNKRIIALATKLCLIKKVMIMTNEIAHGQFFKDNIPNSVFIQGNVDKEQREEWLNEMKDGDRNIIIGTSSIIQKGLNIKNLDVIINATGNVSSIMSLQSLGRTLRKTKGKKHPMFIDFYDEYGHFYEHTLERIRTFKAKGHDVKTIET